MKYLVIWVLYSSLSVSCSGSAWVEREADCTWKSPNGISNAHEAIEVALDYIETKNETKFYRDSVRVSLANNDFWVSFLRTEPILPPEIGLLITKDGCLSYLPFK
jgi:hypothetical protein